MSEWCGVGAGVIRRDSLWSLVSAAAAGCQVRYVRQRQVGNGGSRLIACWSGRLSNARLGRYIQYVCCDTTRPKRGETGV